MLASSRPVPKFVNLAIPQEWHVFAFKKMAMAMKAMTGVMANANLQALKHRENSLLIVKCLFPKWKFNQGMIGPVQDRIQKKLFVA